MSQSPGPIELAPSEHARRFVQWLMGVPAFTRMVWTMSDLLYLQEEFCEAYAHFADGGSAPIKPLTGLMLSRQIARFRDGAPRAPKFHTSVFEADGRPTRIQHYRFGRAEAASNRKAA